MKQSEQKVSKDYNYEIGYETLQSEWKIQCKRTPRGVTLVKGGNNIYLQFKTPNTTRSKYKCACTFSIDGMHEAVRKSYLVKAKLKSLTSETEFWEWYKKEIEEESRLVDDQITFAEAIKKVEDDFWSRPSRTKRKRDKTNPSDLSSWRETYGRFYSYLSPEENINLKTIIQATEKQQKGSRSYKYSVSAMKKLCRLNKKQSLLDSLQELDTTQTEFKDLQTVTLDDFLNWRKEAIGETSELHGNVDTKVRRAWLWVFSMQVVYGLRIHEVFAVANLNKSFTTKDGVTIPALASPDNKENLIVINDKTELGTTTKTGYRLARPNIPPKYPDLIEMLNIKFPLLPGNKPRSKKYDKIRKFYCNKATEQLRRWNAPFTQTHALRHLANLNGMQAGIPLEVRAQSMGYTSAMNDGTYKKRQSTQTTIDLLTQSNQNAIDFVTALAEAKKLVVENEDDKEVIIRLLSIIYQKDSKAIAKLI